MSRCWYSCGVTRVSRPSLVIRLKRPVSTTSTCTPLTLMGGGGGGGGGFGPSGGGGRRRRNELRAKERGRAGVVEDAEHQLAGLLVDARAAANHLVEQNRRLDVAEEDDVANARDVDAGGEQVLGGGDEMRPLALAEIRDEFLAVRLTPCT